MDASSYEYVFNIKFFINIIYSSFIRFWLLHLSQMSWTEFAKKLHFTLHF